MIHVQKQPFFSTRRRISAILGNKQHPVRHGGKGPEQSVILAAACCRKTNAAKLKFPKQGKKRRVQFTFSIKQRPIHIGRNKFDGIHNAARIIVYPYFQGKSGFRQHGADSERKDQEASSKDTVLSIILRENLHFFHKFQLPSFYRECSSGKCK